MLISRCAWHQRYRGHTKWMGLKFDGRLGVSFTDGICIPCAMRLRIEALTLRHARPALRVVK